MAELISQDEAVNYLKTLVNEQGFKVVVSELEEDSGAHILRFAVPQSSQPIGSIIVPRHSFALSPQQAPEALKGLALGAIRAALKTPIVPEVQNGA